MKFFHFESDQRNKFSIVTGIPFFWIVLTYLFMFLFYLEHRRLPIPSFDDPKNESYSFLYLIIASGFFIALLSYFYSIIEILRKLNNQEIKLGRKIILVVSTLLFTIQLKYDPFSLIEWIGD
jgi:hypothetical protein